MPRPRVRVMTTKSGLRVKHGTANAYSNHRCRCARCKRGWAKYNKQRAWAKGQHLPLDTYKTLQLTWKRYGRPA